MQFWGYVQRNLLLSLHIITLQSSYPGMSIRLSPLPFLVKTSKRFDGNIVTFFNIEVFAPLLALLPSET